MIFLLQRRKKKGVVHARNNFLSYVKNLKKEISLYWIYR